MRLSRRDFGLSLLALLAPTRGALGQAPSDQGIGGTGAAPRPPTVGDRGIGGTGVIGTIRRFGSIYVNDLRIAYPSGVEVLIDGAPARAGDMRIGHVAQAVATGPDNALTTRRIEIASEVVGPVEQVTATSLVVLGQTVDLRGAGHIAGLKPGAFVAVFGQRRANGVIVASLVEPRGSGATRIAGPVSADRAGRLSIGSLLLRGAPAGLAGSRVSVEGAMQGGVYVVRRFRSLARPFGPDARRMSIEGFLGRDGRSLGSGLRLSGAGSRAAAAGSGLAVVTGRIGRSGALVADTVRRETRFDLPERGGPAAIHPTLATPPAGLPGLDGDLFRRDALGNTLGNGVGNALGAPGGLLPGQPGGLVPSTPGLGGAGALPGGIGGLPGGLPGGGLLRR